MAARNGSSLPVLAGLGMFSAGAAWLLILLTSDGMYVAHLRGTNIEFSALSVLPGLVFGVMIGLFWLRHAILSLASMLGYMAASTIAYFLAFHGAINVFDRLSDLWSETPALIVSGLVAGLVGTFVLGLATSHLLHGGHASVRGLPVLIGTAAGALLPLINVFSDWNGGFLLFLVFWQGAYAAALAPALRSRRAAVGGTFLVRSERRRV
jgi:hypothetical protein